MNHASHASVSQLDFDSLFERLQEEDSLVVTLPAKAVHLFRVELSRTKELFNRRTAEEFKEERRLYTELLGAPNAGGEVKLACHLVAQSTTGAVRRRKARTAALLDQIKVESASEVFDQAAALRSDGEEE